MVDNTKPNKTDFTKTKTILAKIQCSLSILMNCQGNSESNALVKNMRPHETGFPHKNEIGGNCQYSVYLREAFINVLAEFVR